MLRFNRKALLAGGALITLLLNSAMAVAQGWPNRPLRMVIPYPAGGSVDLSGRRLIEDLSAELGQAVTVDNRSGANGIIGTDLVAKSPPDGYTFLVSTLSAHAGNPFVVKSLPFHPLNDFAPVTVINTVPQVLVAHPDFPALTIAALIRAAREQPGRITYASFGTGGMAHLAMVQLELRGDVRLSHVPYKGGAPALADVMGGHVPLYFSGVNSVLPHLKNGKLKAVAVTSLGRLSALPDVPAIAETYPGFEAGVTPAVWLPARTPPEIIERLHAAIVKVIRTPRFLQAAERAGEGGPVGNRPEEMAEVVRKDLERYAVLIKAAGIRPE